jgi:RNA polymerase sigma factor (sigma-70 family)
MADRAPADDDLMAAARGGSREAFEGIFERYRAPVWAFFRRRVPDAGAAAELTQDVFVAVLEAAPRYEPRGAFRSYVFGVAHHVLSAWRRRSHVHADFSWPAGLDPPAPGSDLIAVLWIRRALAELDDEDREILMLREYDALSYAEIADALGLPLNTVRSRLFRARLTLKSKLEAESKPQGVHP